MNKRGKGHSYKEYANRAYAYYKQNGIFGSFANVWQWLLNKPERLTALSTLAIFLATAVAVGVGIAQWRALRSTDEATHAAATIANQTLISTQRAWLGPIGANLEVAITEANKPTIVAIQFQNSGREPAREVNFRVYPVPHPIPEMRDDRMTMNPQFMTEFAAAKMTMDRMFNDCKTVFTPTTIGSVIFPSNSPTVIRRPIDGWQIDDGVVKGKKQIMILGCAIYRTMDEVHRTIFCFNYQTPRPLSPLDTCTGYQYAN